MVHLTTGHNHLWQFDIWKPMNKMYEQVFMSYGLDEHGFFTKTSDRL